MKSVPVILFLVCLGFLCGSAQQDVEESCVAKTGAVEAVRLIQALNLDWSLSVTKDIKQAFHNAVDTGRNTHATVESRGCYKLLLAPIPVDHDYRIDPDYNWNVCLVEHDTVVNWVSTTTGTPQVAIAKNGTTAIAEATGEFVRTLTVRDDQGSQISSDVWLGSRQQKNARGLWIRDPGILVVSDTGQWVVVSGMTSYDDEVDTRGLVRVFNCFSGDKWEVDFEGCEVATATFVNAEDLEIGCTSPRLGKHWSGRANIGERRTLNLRTRTVR